MSKRQQRKKLYVKLEDKRGWRIAKVAYWLTVALITWIAMLNVDDYSYDDDGQRWFLFFFIPIMGFVFHWLFKRISVYIAFGSVKEHEEDEE
jgi:hypothetical protein